MKKIVVYFVIIPIPSTTPMASHQRGFSERRRRMTKYAAMTHQRYSMEPYCSIVPMQTAIGEMAAASAATTCAQRRPPSSRAISPVKTIAMLCASAAKNRTPTSEGPKRISARRATKAVQGGYET